MVFLSDCISQLPTTSARDTQQQRSFFFFNSMGLFKNNEVMPFLTTPDTDVMNISPPPTPLLPFVLVSNSHISAGHMGGSFMDLFQDAHGSHIKKSYQLHFFFHPPASVFFLSLARKGLTGCEFLIANSQDRISCNSNQGHLRWAYACLPPLAYCTQRLSVLWFAQPRHVTSLKLPPPFSSLFISSKLFERRGVSQSKTSFPLTTAC